MTFCPKIAVLGENRGRSGVTLTHQQAHSYFWGLLPLYHFWQKSIKKCNSESADRQRDPRCVRDKLNL